MTNAFEVQCDECGHADAPAMFDAWTSEASVAEDNCSDFAQFLAVVTIEKTLHCPECGAQVAEAHSRRALTIPIHWE